MVIVRRLKMILKPELNCKNKITATGVLAVAVLRYIFGIIVCRFEETQKKSTKNWEYANSV
jgi:hypothetical protein